MCRVPSTFSSRDGTREMRTVRRSGVRHDRNVHDYPGVVVRRPPGADVGPDDALGVDVGGGTERAGRDDGGRRRRAGAVARSSVALIPALLVVTLAAAGTVGSGSRTPAGPEAPSPPWPGFPEAPPVGWQPDGTFRPCHFVAASVADATEGLQLGDVPNLIAPGQTRHDMAFVCAVSYADAP